MESRLLAWTLAASVLATAVSSAQQLPPNRRANASYGNLPLTFEVNQGQTSSEVKFMSRGTGHTAFLTTDGMVLSLRPTEVGPSDGLNDLAADRNHQSPMSTTLQFKLAGAVKNPGVVGEDLQPGRINYFFGNDPAKWRTNVPTYAKVRYKNVYPGIDLLYYGNRRQLEYDFELMPGADPNRIQFDIQGSEQIKLDPDGNLVLKKGSEYLRFQSPIIYQVSHGQRVAIDGRYVMKGATGIGFQIGQYNSSQPLVIDPVLVYSTYMGGSGTDEPQGITVDSAGNVYVVGYTNSPDFPLAALGSLPKGKYHVFVAKLDPSGSQLIYADYIGGNSDDEGSALVLDAANDVYVTGSTESSNFPVVKPYQAQQSGPCSGFLSKLSADGSSLLYSTYLGGNTFDRATNIAIDSLGQVRVAGYTLSQNFPVANAYQATALPNQGGIYGVYGFLTTFSADGSTLIYSTYLSGNSNVVQTCGNSPCWPEPYNAVSGLAVDANGNAYVAGTTNTYNFPVTSGAYLTNNSAPQNAPIGFVTKFSSGGTLDYSTYFYGSSGNPVGIAAVAVDGSGSTYFTGNAVSDGTFPITSTSICDPSVYGYGCSYTFVAKLDPTGSDLLYSTFLGINNYAYPQAIALDATGDAYVLTSTQSGLLQMVNAIEPYTNKADLLLVEIDPAATTEMFATYLGGSGNDSPSGLALDTAGNIYIAGFTNSEDLPVTQGVFQIQLAGNQNAFVMKISGASGPSVSLNPTSLRYSPQQIGVASQPQQVLLRNMGSSALGISSISVTGDFAENDNCGNTLSAASNCNLSVVFTPTTVGTRTGSLVVNDDAVGSPHVISLSGSAFGAVVVLAPASLAFPNVEVGSSSAAQTLTLSNNGNANLNISNIQVGGDFAQTNNCPGALAAGSSCTFSITFAPTDSGSRGGQLTISDNVQGSPQTVGFAGTGTDFSLATSPQSVTVKAGATASYTLTVAPVGGAFAGAIQLSCGGAPAQTTCKLGASTVTPGANPVTLILTINTTASQAELLPMNPSQTQPLYAVLIQFQAFGVFGIIVAGSKRWRTKVPRPIVVAILGVALLFMSGCAGGTGISRQTGTTPGTYTITVTGSSGALQHSLPLSLTVQ